MKILWRDHVSAENRGTVVGPVTFVDDGDRVDCTKLGKGGYSVPSIVEPEYIQISKCTADFILLVEKGTQWNRLSEDKFWRRYNCVLITGNGQPPRGVRRLVRRLHEDYKLPVYVLVDNDPWGYYIYSVVKQGSINLAFESQRMPSVTSRCTSTPLRSRGSISTRFIPFRRLHLPSRSMKEARFGRSRNRTIRQAGKRQKKSPWLLSA